MTKMGVIGCGLMGSGIARNYIKNGDTVHVYDINDSAVDTLVSMGAVRSSSPNALSAESDYVILSLTSPDLIRSIVSGSDGLIHSMKKGSVILDMSTNDVSYTREMYQKATASGVYFFDCPLSGGPDGANAGSLTIMVGGDQSKYTDIYPVLDVIGENIEYIGASGAGQAAKLCNNMIVAGIITLLGEAFTVGEMNGIDKKVLAGVFQNGSARTKVMDVFGVNMLEETYDNVKFSLQNLEKDVCLYEKLTASETAEYSISRQVSQLVQSGVSEALGAKDSAVMHEVIKKGFIKNNSSE